MRSDLNLALQIVAVGVCVLLRLTTPGWLLVIFFIFVPVATVALVTQIVLAAAAVPRRRLTTSVSLAFGLRDHPPAADDRVLVMRRWLGHQSGELRSPAVSACWLDVKRVYMQLRPRLRRIYSVVGDLPRLAPIFGPLGFAPTGDPVLVDGAPQQPVWLPTSARGAWTAGWPGSSAPRRRRRPGLALHRPAR